MQVNVHEAKTTPATHHRDPFDRLLIAQVQLEDLTILNWRRTVRAISRWDSFYVNAYSSQPFITGMESMVWSVGHHMLKFGVYGQHLNTYGPNRADTQGFLTFSSGSAITPGNALADMFLGQIGQYTEATATVNGVPVGGMEY
jgi:hypothetical protein